MKKKIFILWILISIFIIPGISKASFFDDGRWYMASSQWDLINWFDPEDRGNLVDSNNRLNWITPGWTDGYEADRFYVSRWYFALNSDFEFTIEFHYNHTGMAMNDGGGVQMGLVKVGPDSQFHYFGIEPGNYIWEMNGNLINKDIYWSGWVTEEFETGAWWKRTNSDGMLYARYDYLDDHLQFLSIEGTSPFDITGGFDIEGIRTKFGLDKLNLVIGGWSNGAALEDGDAYLYNFNIHTGSPVPTPSTIILVASGLIFFVARRIRKK